jgi:hypothetical protein
VPDAPPSNRLVWNPPQEHERRELHDVLPLALNQVQNYRNRESGKANEEERSQKLHDHLTRDKRSRVDR